METWFSKELGDGVTAPIAYAEIEELFNASYQSMGRPPEMAVFTRQVSTGHLHCEVIAYFSPAAISVAMSLGADPCPKPSPAELTMLLGNEKSWQELFPEDTD